MAPPDRLLEIRQACKEAGLPFTLQRQAVAAVMTKAIDHPTADEVHERLLQEHDTIARATVFRTLETFVQVGALRRIPHPGAAARYDAKVHRHHHMVCDQCGKVRDLEDEELNRLPLPDCRTHGFRAVDYSIHLRGLCQDCEPNSAQAD